MTASRRQFLKATGAAGAGLALSFYLPTEACADDPLLLADVERLVAAHDRASRPAATPPIAEPDPEPESKTADAVSPPADRYGPYRLLKAIGQTLGDLPEGLSQAGGRIDAGALPAGVWIGGDCAPGGEDLTVTATAQGRDAAEAIHRHLAGTP